MNYKDLQQTVDGGFSFMVLNTTKIAAPNSLSRLLRPYLGHVIIEKFTFYLTTEKKLYENLLNDAEFMANRKQVYS